MQFIRLLNIKLGPSSLTADSSRYALITFALLIVSCLTTFGQRSYFYFAWDVNQPLTNTSWINQTSTRGAKFGFRKFIGEERRISIGVDLNWNYLQSYKRTETFYTDNGAITTDYFNDIFTIAAAVSGQYYFRTQKHAKLYSIVPNIISIQYQDSVFAGLTLLF